MREMNEKVKEAIAKANMKFSEKVRSGDAEGLASLYTEDTLLLPPNSARVVGRKGTQEFWGSAFRDMGVRDASLKTEELVGSGDTYTEIGNYTLMLRPTEQEAVEDKGKYVVVWKQTDEGWKLHRDIWNSDHPAPK
jgi:uncharacterized protein (TIGR02246 family)